jgi:hypothetical protein
MKEPLLMVNGGIPVSELHHVFADAAGVDSAEDMINGAISGAGLARASSYTTDEVVRICEKLREEPGFVGTMAGLLIAQYKHTL